MTYTLPKTEKRFIRDHFERPKPFAHTQQITQNANHSFTITNPNAYSVEIIVGLQGGSGDTSHSYYDSGRQYWDRNRYNIWRYSHAGRVGNTLSITYKGKLLATAGGGAGTPTYQVANYQGYAWKGGSDDHSHTIRDWTWNGNQNLDNRQGGEYVSLILTLEPNTSAQISVAYNRASNAPNKGSFSISGYV